MKKFAEEDTIQENNEELSPEEDSRSDDYISRWLEEVKQNLILAFNEKRNDPKGIQLYNAYMHYFHHPLNFTVTPQELNISDQSSFTNLKETFAKKLLSLLDEKVHYDYVFLNRPGFLYYKTQIDIFDPFIKQYNCQNYDDFVAKLAKAIDDAKYKYIRGQIEEEKALELVHYFKEFKNCKFSNSNELFSLTEAVNYIMIQHSNGSVTKYLDRIQTNINNNLACKSAIILNKLVTILKTTFPDKTISVAGDDDIASVVWRFGSFSIEYLSLIDDELSRKVSYEPLDPEVKKSTINEFLEEFKYRTFESDYPSDEELKALAKNMFNNKIDPYVLRNFLDYSFAMKYCYHWYKQNNNSMQQFIDGFLTKPAILEKAKEIFNSVSLQDNELDVIEEYLYLEHSPNILAFINKVKDYFAIMELLHNVINTEDYGRSGIANIFKTLRTNPNVVNIDKTRIKELFEISLFNFSEISRKSLEAYKRRFDYQKLLDTFNELKSLFTKKVNIADASLASKIMYVTSHLRLLENAEVFDEYSDKAEKKDPALFNLNLELTPSLRFEVLKDLDFNYFTVGADTNCCQRAGGVGENATIDSFINSQAGVLVLYYNDKIASQSYFHYVPESNGFILDNIEFSGIINKSDLTQIYALYAQKIKEKLNIGYFLCGKSYNKISNFDFGTSELETDPRVFKVENPYTDFDHSNALNLLEPTNPPTDVILSKYAKAMGYSLFAFAERILKTYERHNYIFGI